MISRKQLAACIFLASGSLACADWTGWYTNAYPVGSVFRFDQTNAPRADLYAATNTVTYTNDLRFGVSTSITVRFLSNVQVDDWQGPHTITNAWLYPLRRYYTNGLFSNVVYTARVVSTMCRTSLYVQARDVWAIDAYRAARERALASGSSWGGSSVEMYSHNKELLEAAKAALVAATPLYVDPTNATWRASPALAYTGATITALSPTTVLARIGAPSNWPSYTPWRELNGSGVGMGRYATTRWVIVGSSTGTVTNTSVNACGQSVTLTGTNGQIVTAVCTNTAIVDGFTTLDYGWKFVRAYATNLQITVSEKAVVSVTNRFLGYIKDGDSTPSGICGYGCDNSATSFAAIVSGSFSAWKDYLDAGGGDEMDNGAGGTTNAFAMQRQHTRTTAWAGGYELHQTATGVLAGVVSPMVYTWRGVSIYNDARNNATQSWTTAYGWPIAATTTPAGVDSYMGIGAATWALSNAIAGPSVADLSGGAAACTEDAWSDPDATPPPEMDICGRLMIPQIDIRSAYPRIDASPYSVFDWTVSATNGFRYR